MENCREWDICEFIDVGRCLCGPALLIAVEVDFIFYVDGLR